jgi:hypothetical protein
LIVKIKVTAPPVEGAANEALICFLAENAVCRRVDWKGQVYAGLEPRRSSNLES